MQTRRLWAVGARTLALSGLAFIAGAATTARAFPPASWTSKNPATNASDGCVATAKAKWGLDDTGHVRTVDPGNVLGSFGNPKVFARDATHPARQRLSTAALSAEQIRLLKKAFQLAQALPDDDPRSYVRMAGLHCIYCGGTYTDLAGHAVGDIHADWHFLPFHRGYLLFQERILRKLLHDAGEHNADAFTLPYWEWTTPASNTTANIDIPAFFLQDSLAGPLPCAANIGLASDRKLDVEFYRMTTSSKLSFFGNAGNAGAATSRPHYLPHNEAGGATRTCWMSNLLSSPRNPIFWAHHGMVDRMWHVWAGYHPNSAPTDVGYKDLEYRFVDADGKWVKISGETLSKDLPGDLGYTYH